MFFQRVAASSVFLNEWVSRHSNRLLSVFMEETGFWKSKTIYVFNLLPIINYLLSDVMVIKIFDTYKCLTFSKIFRIILNLVQGFHSGRDFHPQPYEQKDYISVSLTIILTLACCLMQIYIFLQYYLHIKWSLLHIVIGSKIPLKETPSNYEKQKNLTSLM